VAVLVGWFYSKSKQGIYYSFSVSISVRFQFNIRMWYLTPRSRILLLNLAGQENPRLLRKSRVHYQIHKVPPSDTILLQTDPVHKLTPYFVYFNIMFLSKPKSLKWSLPSRLSIFARISHLPNACYLFNSSHSPWFEHLNNIRCRIRIVNFSLCNLFHPPVTSSLLDEIFSALCSQIFSTYVLLIGWETSFTPIQNNS